MNSTQQSKPDNLYPRFDVQMSEEFGGGAATALAFEPIVSEPPTPKIAVAITAYNEMERSGGLWLCENLRQILASSHVGDVVVVNDGTPDYGDLSCMIYEKFGTRVRCQQNSENLAVFGNKLTSVEASRGEWVLVADSDNVFNARFFQRLVDCQPWDQRVAYVASFGKTEFNYRGFIGDWTLANAAEIPRKPCGWCLCNCGNWFVNRERFLSAFDGVPRKRFDLYQPNYFQLDDRAPLYWRHAYDSLDSYYINKRLWLAGGTLRVVDGLEYVHRVDREKPGNFDRGPAEKEALGPIYLVELMDAAAGATHEYTLVKQGGELVYLNRGDGAKVIVNFHTGDVQVCEEQKTTTEEQQVGSSPCEPSVPTGDGETSSRKGRSSRRTRKKTKRRGA